MPLISWIRPQIARLQKKNKSSQTLRAALTPTIYDKRREEAKK